MTAEETLNKFFGLLGKAVLLPIPLGEKGPRFADWQKLTFQESRNHYPALWEAAERGGNIGVLLGPASDRLFALDLDDESLVDEWLARFPWLGNTLRTRGKRGCQFWLRLESNCQYPNGKAVFKLTEAGKTIGELRLGGAGGAQSVIYGLHPDGMRYQIVVDKPPLTISLAHIYDLVPGLVFSDNKPAGSSLPERGSGNHSPAPPAGLWERVVRYLDKCEPAVSGQCGHDTTFGALCAVIHGFDLSREDGLRAARHYNGKCDPPWSEKELTHKVDDVLKTEPDKSRGWLLSSSHPNGTGDGETPLTRELRKEEAQRAAAGCVDAAAPIDLAKETEERFKQYLSDPEPFPPPMRAEAFQGIVGEIVNVMTKHCESSPEVLLLHGLVIIGNVLGRSAYVGAGGPKLFPNEFAVFVGETARGRKGTAYAMWEQLIEVVNRDWLSGCLSSQIQTGEGIVNRVRDERYGIPPGKRKKGEPLEEVLLDAGIADKRLLVLEEEFSHTLKMAQRSGNTLSEVLRQAWNSPPSLKNENKNSPLKASDPHVSLIGHTTRDELLGTLKTVDLNNGMANRVLWCAARRTGDMPNAEFINWKACPDLTERIKEIFGQRFANTSEPDFLSRTDEAKNYWDALYRKLNAEKLSSTMDSVLARDTSHILKLSLIFAIADNASRIERQHLEAALAVVDFCRDSARWVFGHATGNRLANNILTELRRSPKGLTRDEIRNDVCFRNTPKSQIQTALSELAKNKLARMTLEEVKKGPRPERWFAIA